MSKIKKSIFKDISFIYLIPMILAVAIVPLIVFLKMVPVNEAIVNFWNGEKQHADFFSYYKGICVISSAILTIFVMLFGILTKNITVKKTFIYIPLGLYSLLVILSTMFSTYMQTALFGFPDRYEGMYVTLSYLILFLGAVNLISTQKQVKIIFVALFASAAFISIIGIFQFFGLDFFKSDLGKLMILPSQYQSLADNIKFYFDTSNEYKNTIYSTLYNPNNLGSYMSMLFPMAFSLFLLSKNRVHKLLLGILSCLLFSNLIGSGSRGAFIGVCVSFIFIFIILRKSILLNWKSIVLISSCFSLIFIVLNTTSGGFLNKRLQSITAFENTQNKLVNTDKIKDFKIEGKELVLICQNSILKCQIKDNKLIFFDEKDKTVNLEVIESGKKFTLKDERYKEYNISLSGSIVQFKLGNSFMNFKLSPTFELIKSNGKPMNTVNAESFGFNGMENFASNRGYIWSRTIPLLKKTILLGNGPDTFAIYFPQNDIGKLRFMKDINILVDKPHNMYLQIAINTGILSLVSFIVFLGMYIISTILTLRKTITEGFVSFASISIIAGLIGYLISVLATDSVLSVAPVMWVVIGIGIGVNRFAPRNNVYKKET